MKNMNEHPDVNIFYDEGAKAYAVDIHTVSGWVRHANCGELEAAHASAAKAVGVPWVEPMRFSQTFAMYTEESVIQGEADETGYDWQDSPHTFRELVDLLKRDFSDAEPSERGSTPRWIESSAEADIRDGSRESKSLHPANERAQRWWPKALACAGIGLRL